LRPLTGTTGALGFQNDADDNTLTGGRQDERRGQPEPAGIVHRGK